MICFLFVGCGGKGDSSDKQKQSQEVVRKIPVAESQPESKAGQKPTVKPQQDKTAKTATSGQKPAGSDQKPNTATAVKQQPPAEGGQVSDQAAPPQAKQAEIAAITKQAAEEGAKKTTKPPEAEKPVLDDMETSGGTSGQAPDVSAGPEQAPVIDLDVKETAEGDLETGDEEVVDELYNPFAPLFQKQNQGVAVTETPSIRQQRKFLTPLEKIDIGQLTLKGIIMAQTGNRGVVVDASGKGYVVKEGTYIGLNSGTVENIESDRITIVETIGTRQSKTVLKLQKPAGE